MAFALRAPGRCVQPAGHQFPERSVLFLRRGPAGQRRQKNRSGRRHALGKDARGAAASRIVAGWEAWAAAPAWSCGAPAGGRDRLRSSPARIRSSSCESSAGPRSTQAPTRSRAAPGPARPKANDQLGQFASVVLRDTEVTWREVFSKRGRQYEPPLLVLFDQAVRARPAASTSAASRAPSTARATKGLPGPVLLCRELGRRFGARRATSRRAYVIAHEVGHHVQRADRRGREGPARAPARLGRAVQPALRSGSSCGRTASRASGLLLRENRARSSSLATSRRAAPPPRHRRRPAAEDGTGYVQPELDARLVRAARPVAAPGPDQRADRPATTFRSRR